MENHELIPDHQFGFRSKHITTEQIHRIVKRINNDLDADRYRSAVFLDISQAFDNIWHRGLLYKKRLKKSKKDFQLISTSS